MLNDATCFKAVYIVCGYTDLRSGMDRLAALIETQTGNKPYVPDTLYLFCGRRADRIKGLVWEGDGWLLLYKRLSESRFQWPRSPEEVQSQICFMEMDGKIVFFNEAEAATTGASEEERESVRRRKPKEQGKREEDLEGLPVVAVEHSMTQEELENQFGQEGWKQLPDEVYRRYGFTPAKVEVEEHHVKVYAGKKTDEIVRAPHPGCLLRGSLVSPSLEAAVMNAKYVNAVPLYRQEQEFLRYGPHISRQNMANWTIQCADRYLAVLYDCLHEKMYGCHVLQADETPMLVNKDGRPAGSKSYMWVYRAGQMYTDRQIVLYEYQKTRNASHPREFLKGFSGICVTDGYQVYHTIGSEREDLKVAGVLVPCKTAF